MTAYYDNFFPAIGSTTDFAVAYARLLQALDVDIGSGGGGGGGGGGAGGQTCVYLARQSTAKLLADSASSLGRTTTAFLPDTSIITTLTPTAGKITLEADKIYTGWCECTIDSSANDLSACELALLEADNILAGNVIALDEKQLFAGTFDRVRMRFEFALKLKPTLDLDVTLRVGVKGTGCSIPAHQDINGLSNLTLAIFEQV